MRFHPLADAFPLLEGEAFERLKKDIELNGQRDAIVFMNGAILDGRNRWRACQELGIPHRERLYGSRPGDGDDPFAFVWSVNAERRHLTNAQLALAASEMANVMHGGQRLGKSVSETNDRSADRRLDSVRLVDAAKITGVAKRSIQKARTVANAGAPDVLAALRSGALKLDPAERLAHLPLDEQKRIMTDNAIEDVPKAVPDPRWVKEEPALTVVPDPPKETAPPGRGRVRPIFQMRKHLERNGIKEPVFLEEFWKDNTDVIPELPSDLLEEFVRDLKKSRVAIKHLLDMIEKETGRR